MSDTDITVFKQTDDLRGGEINQTLVLTNFNDAARPKALRGFMQCDDDGYILNKHYSDNGTFLSDGVGGQSVSDPTFSLERFDDNYYSGSVGGFDLTVSFQNNGSRIYFEEIAPCGNKSVSIFERTKNTPAP